MICGLGRARIVGISASCWISVYANASSMMTRSPEKPRPEPFERATNLIRASVSRRSKPSSPLVFEILMRTPSISYRFSLLPTCVPSRLMSLRTRRKASIEVLYSCADHRIVSSPRTRKPISTRISRMAPLPFCRATSSAYSKHAHLPSARQASSRSIASRCHGSATSPAFLARSSASWPSVYAYGGWTSTLGLALAVSDPRGEVGDTDTSRRVRSSRARHPLTLANLRQQELEGTGLLSRLRQQPRNIRELRNIGVDIPGESPQHGVQKVKPVSDPTSLLQQHQMRRSQRPDREGLSPHPPAPLPESGGWLHDHPLREKTAAVFFGGIFF